MKGQAKERTYEGVARAAWDLAQEETRALEEIERLLDAGDSERAMDAMRTFFGRKKPPAKETLLYETEERKQAV